MKAFYKWLPWFFIALFAAEIIAIVMPKREKTSFHIREFGQLPVLLNGRIQPFDSVGLNSLRQIRSTGDVPLEQVSTWKFWKHPKKLKPTEWLLEVMMRPEQADERPIFLIHHPDLLGELKLADKGIEKSRLRYYTYNQIAAVRDEVHTQAVHIQKSGLDEKQWNPLQKQTMKLENALTIYERLKNSLRPQNSDDFAKEVDEFQKSIIPGMENWRKREEGKEFDEAALKRFGELARPYLVVSKMALPLIVPPSPTDTSRDNWGNTGTALMAALEGGEVHPAVMWFAQMSTAYRHDDPERFNRAITEYRQWLGQKRQPEVSKGWWEFFYNETNAFLHAIIIYLFAFALAGISLVTFAVAPNLSQSLRWSGFGLVCLAGLVHTANLIFRMVLEGRPPVTNLYSSAIFIGWGAMVLGIVLELIYRVGIGTLIGSLAGFVTLIIAHNLAIGEDTMQMLRAVLDTNFWLATHVVVVTLGYASTFVAGLLAILYVFMGLFTPNLAHKLTRSDSRGMVLTTATLGSRVMAPVAAAIEERPGGLELGKALAKMVYGILCFATLFSFVGTVLGGIWADQSWGRFWGWDPKENGALIIVLWNAVILHARWGGLVRERGLMNMAIVGNIVTSFSWFGVNMLGIGLHSYGFMDAAFAWLMLFIASQLLLIGDGLLPKRFWLSHGAPMGGTVRWLALLVNATAIVVGLFSTLWCYLIVAAFLLAVIGLRLASNEKDAASPPPLKSASLGPKQQPA